MHRFFAGKDAFADGKVYIRGGDVAHITRVLRLKNGDSVTVCDGAGMDYICVVDSADKDTVVLNITESVSCDTESETSITLYQGIPKSDKMDFIIQKCVELGVKKIVPVETARIVAKVKDGDKKIARWQRIAEEAAKQCGRGVIPEIGEVCSFSEAIKASHTLRLMPYECERDGLLSETLKFVSKGADIGIYIGPEGGFDKAEADLAVASGVTTVTLGKRILRCETAGLATVVAVMYALGEWNI